MYFIIVASLQECIGVQTIKMNMAYRNVTVILRGLIVLISPGLLITAPGILYYSYSGLDRYEKYSHFLAPLNHECIQTERKLERRFKCSTMSLQYR